jgi:hypothetical protein
VKGRHYTFVWHGAYDKSEKSTVASREFMDTLIRDFDGTMAKIMQAAGISNPDAELDAASHFAPPTREQLPGIVIAINRDLQRRAEANPVPEGPSFAQILGSAIDQTNAQLATYNQQQSARNAAQMQQIQQQVARNSQNTRPTAVPASSGRAQSAADTAGSSRAKTSTATYTGPDAAWVHKILATAVNWNCSPYRPPPMQTQFTCQRDGYVYQAQQLATAAECSAQTGHPEEAVQDAQQLVKTLRTAGSFCGAQAPTGKVTCDTDRVIACGQFPQ